MSGRIQSAEQAITIAQLTTPTVDGEWFIALYLDRQRRLIRAPVFGLGQECSMAVDPADIFAQAESCGAPWIITVRLHPHPGPLRLRSALPHVKALLRAEPRRGPRLLDYIIGFGDGSWFSFQEHAVPPAACLDRCATGAGSPQIRRGPRSGRGARARSPLGST